MTVIVIRSRVEPDQRHELMQMFKDTSQPNQLPAACLERRLYEEALLLNNLVLIEQWSEGRRCIPIYPRIAFER
jgi:quinol monooxygenase YgiN